MLDTFPLLLYQDPLTIIYKPNERNRTSLEKGGQFMELSKNKTRLYHEYDAFNFLDDFVLNMLTKHKKLSSKEIVKRVQKKVAVTESTINTCLFLMSVNGLVSDQYVGTWNCYKITDEGNQFLKEYDHIKTKILELRHSATDSEETAKKERLLAF
jgi:predicted transcriptional regulator